MDKYEWHLIAVALPLAEEKKKIKVAGKAICLLQVYGKLFAVGNRCPHAGADLSQGWCEGNKIVCPFHRHHFDIETGKGNPGQGNFIPVYPIKEEEGRVYIGIKRSWWKGMF